MGRPPPAPAGRSRPGRRARRRARRGVRRLAASSRDDCRERPDGARLRGSPLGRRRPARLRRRARRLGRRRAAPRRVHGQARVAGAPGRLGRRQAERDDRLARRARRRGHRASRLVAAPPARARRRDSADACRASGGQSALRGGVHPDAAGRRPYRRETAGVGAGNHRGAHRPSSGHREGLAADGRRAREGLLVGRARLRRRHRVVAADRASPLARAEGVRPPRAPVRGRGRDAARVRPRARPRRGLQPAPTRRPGGTSPRGGRVDRVATRRPRRGPGRDPRAPLPHRDRAAACGRRGCHGSGATGRAGLAGRGGAGARARRVRRSHVLPRKCAEAAPRGRRAVSRASLPRGKGACLRGAAR